ncbi:MAG: sensor histidine kinase, partial [Anaerolineae bacterium]|nr:sensor histidine kinase [Anaerolineae bacterium]
QGVLFYIEHPEHAPVQTVQVIAEWATNPRHWLGVGSRHHTLRMAFVQRLLTYPARPLLAENLQARTDIDAPFLEIMQAHAVYGAAILPLSNNRHWIGVLWFTWDTPHTFSPQDDRMYRTMLQHIAPVIDSRRLLAQTHGRATELEETNQELNLLYRTAEVINSANTYREVVEAVAHFDTEADVVSLMLWENLDWEAASYLDIVVMIDRVGNSIIQEGDHLPKENFPVSAAMLGERVWIFEDTQRDPRSDDVTRASWKALNILSFFGTALYSNRRWLGGVTFHSNQPRPYTERQKRLLTGVGDLVLAALERIRLKQQSEQAMQTFAVLEERNRLARELHDSVSQALYGIVLSVKTAQIQLETTPDEVGASLDYALTLSQAALSEMRALIFELRPETLEKEGLVEALSRQAEMIQARYDVVVTCRMEPEPGIPLHIKEHVYWIAREALHNVVKHARASQVNVTLTCAASVLTLQVADNGIGFDPVQDFSGHLGLKSIAERAARLNGTLAITSHPHTGTTVRLDAPLT